MSLAEIRDRILAEHEALRGQLIRLDRAAREVLEGCGDRGSLGQDTLALESSLRAHLALEEEILAPALEEADPWGAERIESFRADHRRQREILDALHRAVGEGESDLGLALMVWGLVRLSLLDMADEERRFVSEELLHDGLVRTDV